jgi:hypothetical protein
MFWLLKDSNWEMQKCDEFLGSYIRIARHPKNLLHEYVTQIFHETIFRGERRDTMECLTYYVLILAEEICL